MQIAERVRAEFLHVWNNYERYAWGHDALRPLSKTAHDWYGEPLLMTPVDALDTLILMKLDHEAAKARALILGSLSFDRDIYVKNCASATIVVVQDVESSRHRTRAL